ncbi:acyltransferase family protein, partial [Microvirga tunisiensis]
VITCMVLVVMAGAERLYTPTNLYDSRTVLIVTLCAAFLVAVAYHNPRAGFLRRPVLVFLGEISYGLYLIHMLVLFMLAHAIAPLIASPVPSEALALNIGLAVATLTLTVLLATAAHYGLEKPCQQLGYKVWDTSTRRMNSPTIFGLKTRRAHS